MAKADVVALSTLSDEPTARGLANLADFSPRLAAVLDRLPDRAGSGNPTRIRNALMAAGVFTLAKLQGKTLAELIWTKSIGLKYAADVERALAAFGLRLRDRVEAVADDVLKMTDDDLRRARDRAQDDVERFTAELERRNRRHDT